jgi:hypothetical protein
VNGVGEIPQPGARRRGVPVDEYPLPVTDDEVPRGEVVVGNDLVPGGGRERLPLRAGRRDEPGDGVVELADQKCPGQATVPETKVRTSRPWSSIPSALGAPRKPTSCR